MSNALISQTGLVIFLAVWAAALLGYIPVEGPLETLMPYLPVWVLCCFGSYSLFTIGWKLVTFGDADAASDELKLEVIEAKKALSAKGMKFE